MTTAYPGALDNLSNPAGNVATNSGTRTHSQQHGDLNDAVEAIEGELGINPSAAYATVDARIAAVEAAVGTDQEVVRDTIATALVAGANVTITPDDPSNTITISATSSSTTAKIVKPTIGLVTGGQNQATFEAREATYGGPCGANVTYIGYTNGIGMPDLRSGAAVSGSYPTTQVGYYNGLFAWQFDQRADVDVVISIRPDPKLNWSGGTQDSAIDAFCAQIRPGRKVIINLWMEIDGYVQGRSSGWGSATGTVAQQSARIVEWQNMVIRIGNRIHSYGNSDIKVAINLQSYAWNPTNTGNASDKGAGQYMTQFTYWTAPMAAAVDIISTNLYNGAGSLALNTRAKMWDPSVVMVPFDAFRNAAGKPGAIWEWGSWEASSAATVGGGATGNEPATKAAWFTASYNYMIGSQQNGGYLYACAWDYQTYTSGTTAEMDINRIDSSTAATAAFAALRDDSETPAALNDDKWLHAQKDLPLQPQALLPLMWVRLLLFVERERLVHLWWQLS
jgi:hypothetical protein